MPSVALTVFLRPSEEGRASTRDPLASDEIAVDRVGAPVPSVLWTALPDTPIRLIARSFGRVGSAGGLTGDEGRRRARWPT